MTWIQTYTRRKFDLAQPSPADVEIEDIAHALSQLCRFTGHTGRLYTVAQHSVIASHLVGPPYRLDALLHDAHEAYLGDVSRPVKQTLGDVWKDLERNVAKVVAAKYRLHWPLPAEVERIDNVLLATECRDLMRGPLDDWTNNLGAPLSDMQFRDVWSPDLAEFTFLARFKELTDRQAPKDLASLKPSLN